jgi:hypothetical protein
LGFYYFEFAPEFGWGTKKHFGRQDHGEPRGVGGSSRLHLMFLVKGQRFAPEEIPEQSGRIWAEVGCPNIGGSPT